MKQLFIGIPYFQYSLALASHSLAIKDTTTLKQNQQYVLSIAK